MASEHWSEGDERAAWELAESYVDDVPTASTNPAVRGFAVQVAYDAIRAATLAERARWRAVGEAAGRLSAKLETMPRGSWIDDEARALASALAAVKGEGGSDA
jgi:hypothetical protein